MQTKILEIRDSGTFIAVMAISMASEDPIQGYYLRRDGYSVDGSTIMLVRLNDGGSQNDPYKWPDGRGRTMNEAHVYIVDHFDELHDGAVIDVEYILGEKPQPKMTERATVPC